MFTRLGFESCETAGRRSSHSFDFGNLQLSAVEGMSRQFEIVYVCSGVLQSDRAIEDVRFQIPLILDSYELGIALMAYYLRNITLTNEPDWLFEGQGFSALLPWKQHRMDYETRPQCLLEREWFSVARNKLRALAETADERDLATFFFDGRALFIEVCGESVIMPGKGEAWTEKFSLSARSLSFLPKRIMNSQVSISIWDEKLIIDRRAWHLVSAES